MEDSDVTWYELLNFGYTYICYYSESLLLTPDPSLVHYVKIATAVAIIRGKPPGKSGELYARELCSQAQRSQLYWKQRSRQLEEEVLLLKQELLQKTWHEQGMLPLADKKGKGC